jgi:predicted permease
MLIDLKIKEGLNPEAARRAALIELGGKEQVKEKVRDARMGHQLETLWRDLRYALRMLGRNPGFAGVAVLSLSLGIGANTAIFSLLDAVLLKMLPVKNPEDLVLLERGKPPGPRYASELSYAFFEQLRAERDVLDGVATFASSLRINAALDGQGEVAQAQQVSGSFFSVLGVNALLGRTITEEDDKAPGAHPVAVISHGYWRRRFASDPAIVGKSVTLNGHPFTIIGVTPPEFFGLTVGEAPDLWAPMMMYAELRPGRSIEEYFNSPMEYVLARRKAGVSEQQARAVLTKLFRQALLAELSPESEQAARQQSIAQTSVSRGLSSLRAQFSEPLRILMALVGLILLIACANVANLLLARATARQKEIAVRLALGASRLRLIRQLLTESLLLAGAGGALGLLFALWGGGFLLALVGSGRNPVFLNLTLDLRALGFTAAVALLAAILFGLVPAWRATRADLTPTLKGGAPAGGSARMGLGKTLVVAQVALSLTLLIGAGLFVRSLAKLKGLDAGFKPENVLLVSTDPRLIGYQGKQVSALYQRLLERFKTIPGVRSATLTRSGLLSEGRMANLGALHIQGRPARPLESFGKTSQFDLPFDCRVGPEFFETVGMTILRGRSFTAQDFTAQADENAPKNTVISETFARHYFGATDPLGQRFGFSAGKSDEFEIVGVVKDAKHNSLREPSPRAFYVPDFSRRDTTFQLRAVTDPTGLIAAVRQAAREVDANLPLYNIKTLATQVDESLAQERLISVVSSVFGLLSLLLASIGLYGIMAYAVSQRTRELGIRMALGARRSLVLLMVLRQGMTLVLLGIGLGLAVSLSGSRIVASQLFGITATDPLTFVGAPILLLTVALVACCAPARRATKVDPLIALRQE